MRKAEGGFSLVEMLVAVTVTLIISGAVYGLIASGQNSFRREPEMADRQQNIRISMALIEQDIESGGAGLPIGAQVFSVALNGVGPEGSIGNPGQVARNGDPSINTDAIEIVGTEDICPALSVCSVAGAALQTLEPLPACMPRPGLFVITNNALFSVNTAVAGAAAMCPPAGDAAQNGNLAAVTALPPWNPLPFVPAAVAPPAKPNTFLFTARIARYRIGPSGEALELANEPALWRSNTGRYTTAGATPAEPGMPGFNPAAPGPWQLVARGIEDLQLEYQYEVAGPALVWENVPRAVNVPPLPAVPDYTTVARAVRVTLSARAVAVNVQGQMTAGAGSTARAAIRGQLARVVAPRATLMGLQMRYRLK
jgi:prepilin-type N-terminal cleavage/methylation domain-containing protein